MSRWSTLETSFCFTDRWLYELSLKQEVDGNIFGGLQGEKSTDPTSL